MTIKIPLSMTLYEGIYRETDRRYPEGCRCAEEEEGGCPWCRTVQRSCDEARERREMQAHSLHWLVL